MLNRIEIRRLHEPQIYGCIFQHCKNVNPPIGSVGLGHVPFDIMFLTKQMDNLKLEVHENTTLKSAMQDPALEIAAGKRIDKKLKNSQKS